MEGLSKPGWGTSPVLLVAVFCLVIGYWAGDGAAYAGSCGGSFWKPVVCFQMAGQMSGGPWAWVTPDLRQALMDGRRELAAAGITALVTGVAYIQGGVPAALKAYTVAGGIPPGRGGGTLRRQGGEVAAVHNVDDEPEWIDPAPREERRRVTRVDRVPALRDSERNCGSGLMGSAGGALVPVRARGIR